MNKQTYAALKKRRRELMKLSVQERQIEQVLATERLGMELDRLTSSYWALQKILQKLGKLADENPQLMAFADLAEEPKAIQACRKCQGTMEWNRDDRSYRCLECGARRQKKLTIE
jgi:hypothetical protein